MNLESGYLTAMRAEYQRLTGALPGEDSDIGIRMALLANQLELLEEELGALRQAADPETAEGEMLDRHADSRRVEGIVPLSAEGLLDQHGRDDSNNDDAVGNAGGHQQHDQRCKALAGRLVGAVALAMQRGQGAITQIGRHQGCQHQQHRAQAVIVPGHARKGHGTPQQITIVAIVLAAFDRRLFCHGAWVLLWVNGCRAAYR